MKIELLLLLLVLLCRLQVSLLFDPEDPIDRVVALVLLLLLLAQSKLLLIVLLLVVVLLLLLVMVLLLLGHLVVRVIETRLAKWIVACRIG